jgi:hypothetical protein
MTDYVLFHSLNAIILSREILIQYDLNSGTKKIPDYYFLTPRSEFVKIASFNPINNSSACIPVEPR